MGVSQEGEEPWVCPRGDRGPLVPGIRCPDVFDMAVFQYEPTVQPQLWAAHPFGPLLLSCLIEFNRLVRSNVSVYHWALELFC